MEDESLKWFTQKKKLLIEVLSLRVREERSEEERTEDAWASGGEEGRGKLRKAAGSCKQALIRRHPNGATRVAEGRTRVKDSGQRRELKHLSTCRKRKKRSIS